LIDKNKSFLFSALALNIAMKEIEQNGHDDERMVLVFNALDQIIPQLGVFSPITAILRNELFGIRKFKSFVVSLFKLNYFLNRFYL